MKKALFAGIVLLTITLVIIGAVELLLRLVTNAPSGRFAGLFPGEEGLYRESAVIEMLWGPIPYVVETNSLGFRGPEIEVPKPADTIRIAALGDSFTDGFFVDNDATYPVQLERTLAQSGYQQVEVVNCARGGGSIDIEYAILKRRVLTLEPDIVVLLFCTNDISDIRGRSREELLSFPLKDSGSTMAQVHRWVLTSTATGETVFDQFLSLRFPSYRSRRVLLESKAPRYRIPGATDIGANCAAFNKRVEHTAADVLVDDLSPDTLERLENYLFALGEMKRLAENNDASLMFAYYPAYTQIVDPTTPMTIRDMLKQGCAELSVEFCDLTEAFRSASTHQILHLAPLDYHLNPVGNRVMAESIAACLSKNEL